MSRLQEAIERIMAVYEEYGGEDGKLDVEEVKRLFDKEIADAEVKEALKSSDLRKPMRRAARDGEISFKEFSRCVGFLANFFYNKKMGKGACCDED